MRKLLFSHQDYGRYQKIQLEITKRLLMSECEGKGKIFEYTRNRLAIASNILECKYVYNENSEQNLKIFMIGKRRTIKMILINVLKYLPFIVNIQNITKG